MSQSLPMPPPIDMANHPFIPAPSADPANAPKYVGFLGALSRAFSQFAKFSGRARRSESWWLVLAPLPGL